MKFLTISQTFYYFLVGFNVTYLMLIRVLVHISSGERSLDELFSVYHLGSSFKVHFKCP